MHIIFRIMVYCVSCRLRILANASKEWLKEDKIKCTWLGMWTSGVKNTVTRGISCRDLDKVKFRSRHCVHIGSMEFQIPWSSATDSPHVSEFHRSLGHSV